MTASVRTWSSLALAGLLLMAAPAWAADLHSYIPGDATFIVQVHCRQMLDAPLVDRDKGYTLHAIWKKELKDPVLLGFKPLEDVRQALIALPSTGEVRKVFFALEGKFDAAAVRGAIVRQFKDSFKEHGTGPMMYWQFQVPSVKLHLVSTPQDVFVAVPDPSLCLISLGSKDDLVTALGDKRPGTPRDLRALLDRADKDQVVSWVLSSHLEGPYAKIKQVKKLFDSFQLIQGGVKIDEEVSGGFTATVVDEATAKESADAFRAAFNGLTGIIALLSQRNPDLIPHLEVMRTLRVSVRDNQIIVRGRLERDAIEEAIKRGMK